ncbi:NAD(P)-dependent oxidoreductase [Actinomadura rugatobispora]|uniref:NAD(P)-dependent oxidoreductase n=1 Tax=Actinomadura rugatobispora TaxID=1994 RepID=A0ABW1A6L6_9ACTN|nr:2-hydroxy-3-oxopropionate reductase [Actinomadura rugatobispora]
MSTRLGFIGLGVMGGPMCRNLVRRAGVPVTAFDVNAQALEAAGAERAASAAEVAERADVVFLSLPGGPQVEDVVLNELLPHARPGQTVVDLSTSPVQLAQRLAATLAEQDVLFLDAPVARTRQAAVDGTLSITVGAPDAAAFDRVEPYLRCMATEVRHCGPPGAGALVKLVNNLVVFETVVALAEAVTLARRTGLVGDETLFDALAAGSAASFALDNHGRKALLPDTHPRGAFPASYMRKDIGYALDLAEQAGLRLPAALLAHELLDAACGAGHEEEYHTVVVRVIDQ